MGDCIFAPNAGALGCGFGDNPGAGLNGTAGDTAPMAFTSLTLFGFLGCPARTENSGDLLSILEIFVNFTQIGGFRSIRLLTLTWIGIVAHAGWITRCYLCCVGWKSSKYYLVMICNFKKNMCEVKSRDCRALASAFRADWRLLHIKYFKQLSKCQSSIESAQLICQRNPVTIKDTPQDQNP